MSKMPTEKSDGPETGDSSDPLFADHHALLIGVSRYQEQDRIGWTLGGIEGAERDASSMRDTLVSIGYPPSQIHCLSDEQATREKILQKLRDLGTLWRARFLLVFWAGHGVSDIDGRSFLLPHDADLGDLDRTALSVDRLVELTRQAEAERKAIFLDTCYSSPRAARIFRIKWGPDQDATEQVPAFVGASTYLALSQAGTGGILTNCLREAMSDCQGTLCDPEGIVHLEDVVAYLQRHLGPRARAAWEQAEKWGPSPQNPYIAFVPGTHMPVGRNVPIHVRRHTVRLPESARKLAAMLDLEHLFGANRR
jgi:hypothetical protein